MLNRHDLDIIEIPQINFGFPKTDDYLQDGFDSRLKGRK
jgi:hypothetical protein